MGCQNISEKISLSRRIKLDIFYHKLRSDNNCLNFDQKSTINRYPMNIVSTNIIAELSQTRFYKGCFVFSTNLGKILLVYIFFKSSSICLCDIGYLFGQKLLRTLIICCSIGLNGCIFFSATTSHSYHINLKSHLVGLFKRIILIKSFSNSKIEAHNNWFDIHLIFLKLFLCQIKVGVPATSKPISWKLIQDLEHMAQFLYVCKERLYWDIFGRISWLYNNMFQFK